MNSGQLWQRCDLRACLSVVLPVAAACLCLTAPSCTMDELIRVTDQFPSASTCGHCHVDIHQEWLGSPHAQAFQNVRFREATDDYEFESCLGCHAPEPRYSSDPPHPRHSQRETGVTCAVCHLEESEMAGPLDPTGMVAPHPVGVATDRYRDSQFCGRCHQGTFHQWQGAALEGKPTCQDCHMPSVLRKMTQPTNAISEVIVSFEKAVKEKRHLFELVPTDLPEEPFSLDLLRDGRTGTLRLLNRLPHALPTGDFGVRVVLIEVQAVNERGQTTTLGQWELSNAGDRALAATSSQKWEFAIPEDTNRIHVLMTRRGRGGASLAVLLDKEVVLP